MVRKLSFLLLSAFCICCSAHAQDSLRSDSTLGKGWSVNGSLNGLITPFLGGGSIYENWTLFGFQAKRTNGQNGFRFGVDLGYQRSNFFDGFNLGRIVDVNADTLTFIVFNWNDYLMRASFGYERRWKGSIGTAYVGIDASVGARYREEWASLQDYVWNVDPSANGTQLSEDQLSTFNSRSTWGWAGGLKPLVGTEIPLTTHWRLIVEGKLDIMATVIRTYSLQEDATFASSGMLNTVDALPLLELRLQYEF